MTHVCLTGRNAKPELIEIADLVTEMAAVKQALGQSRLVTLIGDVKMDRDTNHLEGNRVVWNLATRTSSFDARSASNPGGRVTGRFTVPQKKP